MKSLKALMFKASVLCRYCRYSALSVKAFSKAFPQCFYRTLRNAALPIFVLVYFTSVTGLASAQGQAQPRLPSINLIMAGKTLRTELASTANQRYMGLSFRKTMAENDGMLFVFPTEQPLHFTMRNTLIPLSIAYISADLVILEIIDMPVGPDQVFSSKDAAKFALEVNQGWFERNKVTAGTKISMGQ